MEEGVLTDILGIDVEVWNNMPVFEQIKAIEENTQNIDANTKAILEELQKEDSIDQLVESPEFQSLMTGEAVEEIPEEVETIEEVPVEETIEEVPEELVEGEETVEEVPVEETPDYLQLIYDEMVISNQNAELNHAAVMEQLTLIEEHGVYSNETDGMLGLYLAWLVPFGVVIFVLSKMISPFTKY